MIFEYINNVYYYPFGCNVDIDCSIVQGNHKMPLNRDDRDRVVCKYADYLNINIHNGKSVNLESVLDNDLNFVIEVSVIEFFDVFLFNRLRGIDSGFIEYLENLSDFTDIEIYRMLVAYNQSLMAKYSNISEFIENSDIPKPIAVSVMVCTLDGFYLVTERPAHLAIGGGLSSVSVTGAVEVEDLKHSNPFASCISRELREELNLDISIEDIELLGIGLGERKMQPVVLANVVVDIDYKSIIHDSRNASEYTLEVEGLRALTADGLKKFIEDNNLTEIGKFHIQMLMGK